MGNVNYYSTILSRGKRESNFTTDKQIIWAGVGWIHLAHCRDLFLVFVNTVKPSGFMKCGGFSRCAKISLSSTTLLQEVIHCEIEDVSKCV